MMEAAGRGQPASQSTNPTQREHLAVGSDDEATRQLEESSYTPPPSDPILPSRYLRYLPQRLLLQRRIQTLQHLRGAAAPMVQISMHAMSGGRSWATQAAWSSNVLALTEPRAIAGLGRRLVVLRRDVPVLQREQHGVGGHVDANPRSSSLRLPFQKALVRPVHAKLALGKLRLWRRGELSPVLRPPPPFPPRRAAAASPPLPAHTAAATSHLPAYSPTHPPPPPSSTTTTGTAYFPSSEHPERSARRLS